MGLPADALADALGGTGGAPPAPGVLQVVGVPRFDPGVTSLRAAVLVAAADVVRVPPELPPDVLAPLVTGEVVAGVLPAVTPADVDGRVVVQLVATAVQGSPAVSETLARLREDGVVLEVTPSVGELDAALAASGIGIGVARSPRDSDRLDAAVLAADRPDLAEWRKGLAVRGYLDHTPVVLVEGAGTPHQRAHRLPLRGLAEMEVMTPVVAVVGDGPVGPVDWRADLPLRAVTVLNPRATHQAPALTARLRSLGAAVVEAPLLSVEPGDLDGLDAASGELAAGRFDAVCLTSPNGVRALAASLARVGADARALAAVRTVACVGPGTAATLWDELRVTADLVPDVHTTAGLAAAMGPAPTGGAVALLPRADLATEELPAGLTDAGWTVHGVDAYRTVPTPFAPHVLEGLAQGAVQLVPVLSSSMARALVEQGRQQGVAAGIVSIGPVTSATLRELGVEPIAEADPHDLDGTVAAVVAAATGLTG